MSGQVPVLLGTDSVVRFQDAEHFLRELGGNLGRGRVFVKTKLRLEPQATLTIRIEGPGVSWGLSAEAVVVFSKDGYAGLEFEDFEASVAPKLDLLGEAVAHANTPPDVTAERTVIAPMPPPPTRPVVASPVVARKGGGQASDEERTNVFDQAEVREVGRRARRRRSSRSRAGRSKSSSGKTRPTREPGEPEVLDLGSGAARVNGAQDDQALEPAPGTTTASPLPVTAGQQKAARPTPTEGPGETQAKPSAPAATALRPARSSGEEPVPVGRGREPVEPAERREQSGAFSVTPVPDSEVDDIDIEEFEDSAPDSGPFRAEADVKPSDLLEDDADVDPAQEPPRSAVPGPAPGREVGRPRLADEADELEARRADNRPRANDTRGAKGRASAKADDPAPAPRGAPTADVSPPAPSAEALPPPPPPPPTPEPVVAPSPPAPPIVPIEGQEALEDRALALPRANGSGVVRGIDVPALLGLYLSQIRHGHLTLYGGPEGAPGAPVRVKIAGSRVLTLEARIIARLGGWVTLAIPDSTPVEEALRDARESWQEALAPLAGLADRPPPAAEPKAPPPAAATPPSPPPEPPRAEPPAAKAAPAEDPARVEPAEAAPAAPKSAAAEPAAAPPPPAPAPSIFEDDRPAPKIAKLNGDVVNFLRPKDLRHEIDTNLKNGGLFVESPPLPIRSKKTVKVMVGPLALPVSIECDVVFAAGGRVGFSVVRAAETKAALEKALESLLAQPATRSAPAGAPPVVAQPTPVVSASPPTQAATAASPPASAGAGSGGSEDLQVQLRTPAPEVSSIPAFTGRIVRPTPAAELLDYQNRKPKAVADLVNAPMIQVFEYICRQNARGVLSARTSEARISIYFHEGSVAYVESSPFDEATSLGRILVTSKKLSEPALRDALDRSKQQKKSLGRVLVSIGAITKKTLSDALREQAREKIDRTFAWPEGSYEWTAWREPPGDADLVLTKGMSVFGRFVRSAFETVGLSDLEALFTKLMSRVLVPREGLDSLAPILGLQQKDMRFVEVALDGEKSVADALTGSNLGRLASLRLIASGIALGFLVFRDGRAVPTSGVLPARSRSAKENPQLAQLKRELRERLGLLKTMNFFEMLGVHWSAHHRLYRNAYEKAKADLNPAKPPLAGAPSDVLELAREISRLLDTAFNTLSKEQDRISYRKQLFDKTERQYSADMLMKQGEVALMRGDRAGAMESLETAVELDPSPRNRALLATARESKR